MDFNIDTKVNIVSGKFCVSRNGGLLKLGEKAFIVCGKHGAKASGALYDVTTELDKLGIEYTIFDRSVENPPAEMCFEAAELCRNSRSDFVIGIGGGSALDAAKAVAAYAANPDIGVLDIYDASKRKAAALPIVAIPTTSGTGSEANGTSVLSLPGGKVKRSFTADFPTVAFLDPRYTYSMPHGASLSCALDAFAHAFESYLSPKSTDKSRAAAIYAARNIFGVIEKPEYDESDREALQNAACAAGYAISVTGTGFPHPMGYSLTMLDGITHGAACAIFYRYYVEYNLKNAEGKRLIEDFCREALDGTSPERVAELIPALSGVALSLTEDEISDRVSLISGAKNYVNSPYVLSDDEKYDIYRKLFLKKN